MRDVPADRNPEPPSLAVVFNIWSVELLVVKCHVLAIHWGDACSGTQYV
jgi:hypothetical protein